MAVVPRTEQIVSTLRPAELADLDYVADLLEVSRAEAIRRFVLAAVARNIKASKPE